MARLTVSYSIAFIPGLPRPLALAEVIDDVLGLSTLSSRHTVRKEPGTPDRLDIVVPVDDDLPTALDAAAKAADELTRIGESLLGLGFVVEERAIRVDGLSENWLPDTFDGAGTRHHAPTALDAAAPLPDELEEPNGDVPDELLRLDKLHDVPAADRPRDPLPLPGTDDEAGEGDAFGAGLGAFDDAEGDPFGVAEEDPDDAFGDADEDDDGFGPVDEDDDAVLEADALLVAARAARHGARGVALRGRRDPAERHHDPAAARRRRLLRPPAPEPSPAPPPSWRAERRAFALFALAFLAVVAPWRLGVSTGSILGLAFAAALLAAGVAGVWPTVRSFGARIALTGTVTLALVLTFASAYAICASDGDLRGTGDHTATVGQSLSAAVSLGAAPGLSLGPGARAVAYAERLLVLLALAGAGAHVVRTAPSRGSREPRRDLR